VSETSQGLGWWKASDGKWYAPEHHPNYQSPASRRTGTHGRRTTSELLQPHIPVDAVAPDQGSDRFKRRRAIAYVGICLLVILALVLFVGSLGSNKIHSGNLIRNGSFEEPRVPIGSYQLLSKGQAFVGWNVVGIGNVAVISRSYTSEGLSFPVPNGRQWLDMTGLSNSSVGVSQRVATKIGDHYTLTFEVGNQDDPKGIYGTKSTVDVFVNGTPLLIATNRIDNGTKRQVWKFFSHQFTAIRTTTTVRFMNGDSPRDNTNGLDGVSIRRDPS
jgi:hypothetical protein